MRRKHKVESKKPLLISLGISLFLIILFAIFFWLSQTNERVQLLLASFGQKPIVAPLPHKNPEEEVRNLLIEKGVHVAEIRMVSDSAILVTLTTGTQVLMNPFKDITVQVNSLQIIVNKLTIEGKQPKRIDLRFKDPIVVY
jgi:hypothetical protein